MQKESVHDIIRRAEQNYLRGSAQLGEYVTFSMHDTIETTYAYLNSKHTSGDKDSLGREKPFFNIVVAAANIWYRATDIDRKDMVIRADKLSNVVGAFLATVVLKDWMRKVNFGQFLNRWGRILAEYGSDVVKFVEKKVNGEKTLFPIALGWLNQIVDQQDFGALPHIEKLYKTPGQLEAEKLYDQDIVKELVNATQSRKTLDKTETDQQDEFIELYEVNGLLPNALLKQNPTDKDWQEYSEQIHIVSYVEKKEKVKGESGYQDYSLYKGKKKKNNIKLTHLIEQEKRTLAIGSVEYLFDSQWMVNHGMKNMKDTLDLSSKLIFQTADANFLGRNVLSAVETGDILIHQLNMPLTQINNTKADINALVSFVNQWKVLGQEVSATPEATRGITPPSGTPYSTTALLTAQATSLFEIMLENKALALEEMLREFVIPHIKTKLNNKDEIMAILEDHDIKKIDAMYIPAQAIRQHKKRAINQLFNMVKPDKFNKMEEESKIAEQFAVLGNERSFSPGDVDWSEVLKDLEWNLEVGITNESTDKLTLLTSLNTTLQTIASLAGRQMTPDERLVFNKIMNTAGAVSPIELSTTSALPSPGLNVGNMMGNIGKGKVGALPV